MTHVTFVAQCPHASNCSVLAARAEVLCFVHCVPSATRTVPAHHLSVKRMNECSIIPRCDYSRFCVPGPHRPPRRSRTPWRPWSFGGHKPFFPHQAQHASQFSPHLLTHHRPGRVAGASNFHCPPSLPPNFPVTHDLSHLCPPPTGSRWFPRGERRRW